VRDSLSAVSAQAAVEQNPVWYHTLDLPGDVVTPGRIDLRRVATRLLPGDLRGKRALDIGTFDGFWAFELERRGAEVVAIDIEHVADAELPPNNRRRLERGAEQLDVRLGLGFEIAAELLGSNATKVACNVLDLTPEAIGGPVDVAFIGALLIHLRDPVRALERIWHTLEPGGELYQLEAISLRLSLLHPRRAVARMQTLETNFNWWYPNWATLRDWLLTAGFVDVRGRGLHHPPQLKPMNDWFRGVSSRRPA
jgi:SAM-dependent methyltransferase